MIVLSEYENDGFFPRRLKDCRKTAMPICLENAMIIMFGVGNKENVKTIAEKDFSKPASVNNSRELWALYESYIGALRNRIGNDSARVIEYQVKKVIESLKCTECPVYRKILENSDESSPDKL